MQPIPWGQEFFIGISEIDEQHRHLVGLINSLTDNQGRNDAASTDAVLAELNDYVRDHFRLEGRLMDGACFNAEFVARHRADHAYFVGAFSRFHGGFPQRTQRGYRLLDRVFGALATASHCSR